MHELETDSSHDAPFDRLGGEEGVVRLVDRFYELMDTLPEAATIRAMHARNLKVSRFRLTRFLISWLGGPPIYQEIRGHEHPRLDPYHHPFRIDEDARDAWMLCMRQALAEHVDDVTLREHLADALDGIADHLRNVP
ncbi:globin [Bradymonadaceae bacterium TMQ3]|nr:globin [Bradymonadaceae bacterium TMQ3]TXC69381.1 group II truncated hemoglobin [Bradymonadales bacterium TMQ1]